MKTPAAFEEMRHHLLNLCSGVSVAHSFVSGERIFDCIPIEDEPGVRLRKLKTVAEPPPSPPAGVSGEGHESGSPSVAEVQDAGGRDALGNAQQCEDGTIPVRRLTLEELTRFRNPERLPGEAAIEWDRGSMRASDSLQPRIRPTRSKSSLTNRTSPVLTLIRMQWRHRILRLAVTLDDRPDPPPTLVRKIYVIPVVPPQPRRCLNSGA